MPNSTVKAYNKAVIAIVNAAELEKIEDAPEPEAEPTPEQKKHRAELIENLKRRGGKLAEGKTCPECGKEVALLPHSGSNYLVCLDQFQEEPNCYWSDEQKKEKAQSDSDSIGGDDAADDTTDGASSIPRGNTEDSQVKPPRAKAKGRK